MARTSNTFLAFKKLKKHIREDHQMRSAHETYVALDDQIRVLIARATAVAKEERKKTVKARHIEFAIKNP